MRGVHYNPLPQYLINMLKKSSCIGKVGKITQIVYTDVGLKCKQKIPFLPLPPSLQLETFILAKENQTLIGGFWLLWAETEWEGVGSGGERKMSRSIGLLFQVAPIFGYLGDRYSRKYIMAAGNHTVVLMYQLLYYTLLQVIQCTSWFCQLYELKFYLKLVLHALVQFIHILNTVLQFNLCTLC